MRPRSVRSCPSRREGKDGTGGSGVNPPIITKTDAQAAGSDLAASEINNVASTLNDSMKGLKLKYVELLENHKKETKELHHIIDETEGKSKVQLLTIENLEKRVSELKTALQTENGTELVFVPDKRRSRCSTKRSLLWRDHRHQEATRWG